MVMQISLDHRPGLPLHEHSIESSDTIKGGGLSDQLSDCWLLTKNTSVKFYALMWIKVLAAGSGRLESDPRIGPRSQ